MAKFHLDRLVADGLLEVEYARPPGRGGPGAGRPAKLYRRSPRQLTVSLPPREYELAGRILARAVTTSERDHIPVAVTLSDSARDIGRALGQKAREQAGGSTGEAGDAGRPTGERAGGQDPPGSKRTGLVAAAVGVLTDYGYEPAPDPTGITLTNCPFHALAQDYTDLVCGMNLEVMTGLAETLEESRLEARLATGPRPVLCPPGSVQHVSSPTHEDTEVPALTNLHRLYELQGQSPWLDNLPRTYLRDGTLRRYVERGHPGRDGQPHHPGQSHRGIRRL